jgi:hypothetical protein
MPVFPEEGRLEEMRRLGLSEPLVRLAAGEVLHPAFETCFVGPPSYVYGGWVEDEEDDYFPGGPTFVPFWSFADAVQGVWEAEGGLEFIDLYIEDPDNPKLLARTEQGFLAWVFTDLYEYNWDDPEDFAQLPEAAAVVGYRHFAEWAEAFDRHEGGYDSYKRLCKEFIARIDALKTSRDRRPTK